MRRRIVVLACLAASAAVTCDFPYRPPQERFRTASAVFVATAANATANRNYADPVSFHVEEAFKGTSTGATILIYPGMGDCASRFKPGIRYLVFASGSGGLPVAGTPSLSLPVTGRAAELRWLRGRHRNDWKPSLLGVVANLETPEKPLAGVEVKLTRQQATTTARTDVDGVYEFDRLTPGDYELHAFFAGHRIVGETVTLRLGGACVFRDLYMPAASR